MERTTERLLDAAFKELDRYLVSGEASPVADEFVAAALVLLERRIRGASDSFAVT